MRCKCCDYDMICFDKPAMKKKEIENHELHQDCNCVLIFFLGCFKIQSFLKTCHHFGMFTIILHFFGSLSILNLRTGFESTIENCLDLFWLVNVIRFLPSFGETLKRLQLLIVVGFLLQSHWKNAFCSQVLFHVC